MLTEFYHWLLTQPPEITIATIFLLALPVNALWIAVLHSTAQERRTTNLPPTRDDYNSHYNRARRQALRNLDIAERRRQGGH